MAWKLAIFALMKVFINGEERQLTTNSITLKTLLKTYYPHLLEAKGIAIAVNQEVVPKSRWENYRLKEKDKIEIVSAFQGG